MLLQKGSSFQLHDDNLVTSLKALNCVVGAGHYELDLVIPHYRSAAQRLGDASGGEADKAPWSEWQVEDLQVSSSPGPPDNWAGVMPTR